MMRPSPDNHTYDLPSLWRVLHYYHVYCLALSSLLVFLFWLEQLPDPWGRYSPEVFGWAAHTYWLVNLGLFCLSLIAYPGFSRQVLLRTLADVLSLTTLMYASAGLNSGFGILLFVAVASGSILTARRMAIFIAALASLAVLLEEFYIKLHTVQAVGSHVQAGVLGLAFFATAFITHLLATRLRNTEQLARQRAIELRHLSQLNERIVHKMQAGILVIDPELRIGLCNRSAQTMLGLERVQGGELKQVSSQIFEHFIRWQRQKRATSPTIHVQESNMDIQLAFSQLATESGFEALIFLEDVAALKQRVQQTKLASLGRLAASIAHEIRNPLGAISHASQLLAESSAITAEDRQLTSIITWHSDKINNMIENVMSISRRQQPRFRVIGLGAWLEYFVRDFEHRYTLKTGSICLPTAKDVQVNIDPNQLEQIMHNLLENGIRYSRGHPLIDIQYDVLQDMARPYLDVIDHGTGMSEGEAQQLFEPFFTTRVNGSGLGLYIARELCEANQANLSLAKNGPKGCCFRILFTHSDKRHNMP